MLGRNPVVRLFKRGNGKERAKLSLEAGTDDTVWFATQKSVVGIYDPRAPDGQNISWLKLAEDERIDNSFSTTVDGRAAVVTSKAIYLLWQDYDNRPYVAWRHAYDAGSARRHARYNCQAPGSVDSVGFR